MFPDAWAEAQARHLVISDTEWLANPLKRICFSSGDGSTTFRLPDKNGKSSGSVGAPVGRGDGYLSSGVPGTIQMDAIRAHTHGVPARWNAAAGNSDTTRLEMANVASGGPSNVASASFGAEETRMLNFTGVWVIKLAGSALNQGQINALELASQITLLTSRITTLESDAFTASQVASTPWINATLQNGWSASGGRAAYRKVNGMLQIDIIAVSGGTTSGVVTLFTLPGGYRPVIGRIFVLVAASPWTTGGFPPRISILPDGNVNIEAISPSSPLYLSISLPLQ